MKLFYHLANFFVSSFLLTNLVSLSVQLYLVFGSPIVFISSMGLSLIVPIFAIIVANKINEFNYEN